MSAELDPQFAFLSAWYSTEVGARLVAGKDLADAEAAARGALAALTARMGTESQHRLAQVAAALLGDLERGDDVGGRVTPLAPRGGPATPAARPAQRRRAPAPWQLDQQTEARLPAAKPGPIVPDSARQGHLEPGKGPSGPEVPRGE